jgi:hypothetical protein
VLHIKHLAILTCSKYFWFSVSTTVRKFVPFAFALYSGAERPCILCVTDVF